MGNSVYNVFVCCLLSIPKVSHVWPRVTPRGAVRFETTRLGEATETAVIVDNPSDQPLMMQAYVSTTGGPEVQSIVAAQHGMRSSE